VRDDALILAESIMVDGLTESRLTAADHAKREQKCVCTLLLSLLDDGEICWCNVAANQFANEM